LLDKANSIERFLSEIQKKNTKVFSKKNNFLLLLVLGYFYKKRILRFVALAMKVVDFIFFYEVARQNKKGTNTFYNSL